MSTFLYVFFSKNPNDEHLQEAGEIMKLKKFHVEKLVGESFRLKLERFERS